MELNTENIGDLAAAKTPDRGIVARIALHLASLKANPNSEDNQKAVHADIQTFGRAAYYQAAVQNLAPGQAANPQAAQPLGTAQAVTGAAPAPIDQGQARQTWQDCIGSRQAQPLRIFHPATLGDLLAILQEAEANGCRVKAVGSGHSFSDVAGTRDYLVETHGLNHLLALEAELLRPGAMPATLFETEAGIVLSDLNDALWAQGLGLENMGGFDGQTIAGIISTSTHGSGLAFGPICDQVVSLTLAAAGGRLVRVEPAGGITDPVKWAQRRADIQLIQDDDWFHACQVGLGCMGIVYSVVLRVRPNFFLEELRTLSTWSQVRQDLQNGQVLQDNAHYEVLVNPYATRPDGDHTCLVTRRNPVAEPDKTNDDLPHRNFLVELTANIPGAGAALLAVLDAFPDATPHLVDDAMQSIVGEYIDRSYRVFNVGAANELPAYGSEIGFPLVRCVEAVDQILATAGQRQALGHTYLNSPFSLRFVKASPAHLSMMQGTDTCMVEMLSLDHTVGGKEILQELETEMYALGGRPHWGLLNFLSGAGGLIEAMYPLLPRWQAVRAELDPHARFANAFTERCGLTPRA